MAVLGDEVFVADKGRVQRFDLDGKYLGAWSSRGRNPGQILKAQHLSAGPDGNIYIVDTVLKRVQAFRPDGQLVTGWPIPVKNLRYPSVICVTPKGEIIVADERGPGVVIYKFSSSGKLLTSWGEPGDGQSEFDAGKFSGTTGCACSPDGRVYFSEDGSDRIQAFDFEGKFLFSFGGAPGAQPNGAVALSGDSLLVTDTDSGNVSKFRLTE
jgi:DNA-binding beta-propeller fold protein YncE